MPKYRYEGSDERVFPTLSLVVQPNTEFDAPEGFSAHDVVAVAAAKPTKSASSDVTEGA